MPGFALLPKPLLFRNHDCVNMKPGHINCSCFQRRGEKKNNGFFLSCLFLCFNMKLNYWTWCLQNRGRSRLGWHSTCDQRLSAEDTRQDSPGPKLPSLHPHLFLAAVLLKHSGSSSYFYVTTSAKSLIIFPIFWGIAYLKRDGVTLHLPSCPWVNSLQFYAFLWYHEKRSQLKPISEKRISIFKKLVKS